MSQDFLLLQSSPGIVKNNVPDIIFIQPGVIPKLLAGLGNQLFMAAAAFCAGEAHESPVYLLNEEDNKHNTLKLDYRDSALKYLGIKIPQNLNQVLHLLKGYSYYQHPDFEPWHVSQLKPPIVLGGFFQFISHIEVNEEVVRSKILQGLEETRLRMKERYNNINFAETAFLHVRRGDYLEKPEFHYNIGLEYYKKAFKALLYHSYKKTVKKLFIFSDDVEWVKSQPELMNLSDVHVVEDELNEVEALSLMTLCEAGAICANSTFSWWGAFLGCHASREAPICVPSKWINMTVYDLIPCGWFTIGC